MNRESRLQSVSNLKDYYVKEQEIKDEQDVKAEASFEGEQIQIANNLRDLIAEIIHDVLILADTVRPEAYPVSWRIKRNLNFFQTRFGAEAFIDYETFAWDIGSNYFLTIDGILLIQRRRNRDYRADSYNYIYIESFPKRGSMDDPYNACEHLIDFMEKLGAPEDDISIKRNTLKLIKD